MCLDELTGDKLRRLILEKKLEENEMAQVKN